MNELFDSLPATILEQRLLFFSWLPSSFSINSFSEPKVKVIDTKYKIVKETYKDFFWENVLFFTSWVDFLYEQCLASGDVQKLC